MPFVEDDSFHPLGAAQERPGLAAPPPTRGGRMRFWAAFGGALGAVFRYPSALVKAAVFPIALQLALLAPPLVILSDRLVDALAAGVLGGHLTLPMDRFLAPITLAIFILVSFIATSLFLASWARVLVLGPDRAAVTWMPQWDRRIWRIVRTRIFVLACLVFATVFAIAGLRGVFALLPSSLAAAPGIAGGVFSLAALILAARLSVGTVAAAMDGPWTVDEALRATRRHSLRLTFGVLLSAILGGVVCLMIFAIVTLGALMALSPDLADIDAANPEGIMAVADDGRGAILLVVSAISALLSWYILRACGFAFLAQAWLFFRRGPQAPERSSPAAFKRFEPLLGAGAPQGTRSGGAWPGDLTRYEPGGSEREEDWVEPSEPRRYVDPFESLRQRPASDDEKDDQERNG